MLKSVFVWSKEFETDFDKIDTEHKYLVEIINSLGKRLSQANPTFKELEPIFNELFDYTKYHFKNEEALMEQIKIDSRHTKEHISAHKAFITEVTSQYERIDKRNIKESAKELLDFLVQWLTFHILGMDKNLTTQIKLIESGYTSESAFNELNGLNHEQLDTLVKSFNGVFGVLMKYNEELLMLKKSLEEKVQERTAELEEANKKLEYMAMTDQLTGLANRHKTMPKLDKYWNEFIKNGSIFSVIMIDLDNFKTINDRYGHDVGDDVLKTFSQTLKFSIRTDDLACRLGGDEFFIICPNTNKDGVKKLANKIHKNIENSYIDLSDKKLKYSSSMGVATVTKEMKRKEDLLKASDNAVYQAKKLGKNQIFIY